MRHPALDLVNSMHFRGGQPPHDRLSEPAWCDSFERRWGYQPVTKTERARLQELRELLRSIIETLTAQQVVEPEELDALNRWLPQLRGDLRKAPDTGAPVWHIETASASISTNVAYAFAELLAHASDRLKTCANPECRWAFYDESRNRVRQWCDSRACGNVMKARRHRARQRESAQRQPSA